MILPDSWSGLRQLTAARIALGRVGSGLPTAAHLAFQAAHAEARDAVQTPLDVAALTRELTELGCPVLAVTSAAPDRASYLRRPDLGRQLCQASQDSLSVPMKAPDVALVIGDGLSSRAVQNNAVPVLAHLLPRLVGAGLSVGPVVIATQARVALGDHVGALLQARCVLVLIGERPGLSAADSLGIYITWRPHRGRVDSERNCLSNIRPGGMKAADAAAQAATLVQAMMRHGCAGVALAPLMAAEQGGVLADQRIQPDG